jgi:hypothetical protein
MRRARAHRLTRLEQHAQILPRTWAEVYAAEEGLRLHARASVDAVLHGHDAPGRDEGQSQADRARLERWCAGQGARARLHARLKTIAVRHAADPPQCFPAPSPR